MTLRDLLGDGPDVEVVALAYDNRAVTPGTLFFCVPGFTRDGHDFAPDAVARGAAALVVQRPLGLGVPEVLVDDVRAAMAPRRRAASTAIRRPSSRSSGSPARAGRRRRPTYRAPPARGRGPAVRPARRRHVGRRRRGAAGGAHHAGGDRPAGDVPRDARRRRPRVRDGGLLARARAAARRRHPLRRRRVHEPQPGPSRLPPRHGDVLRGQARGCSRGSTSGAGSSSSTTSGAGGSRTRFPDAVTVSLDGPADWQAVDHCAGLGGNAFTVRSPAGEAAVELPLRGRFNAANALVALAAGEALGAGAGPMAEALATVTPVPGRVQAVDEGQDFAVLVDYSHKPGALENVLTSARELASGRVLVVFGAGGDRDRAKRPLMGEIAARLADVAIVTSDNPRSEPPDAIIDEIFGRRCPPGAFHVEREVDRRRGDRPRDRARRGRRRRGDRRQGARAGTGVRGRAQGAVRRRRGRARGAAGGGARDEDWSDQRIAGAAGAELVRGLDGAAEGPARVVIDSRTVEPGDLFVALPGERVDGGRFAADALRGGAWGVLAAPAWAREAAAAAQGGVVLAAEHPVAALGALARAWRRDLARARDRGHRLGRQDVDEGPDRRADRPAPHRRRQPRELQHGDRAAARAARRAARAPRCSCSSWRCAASARSPS